MTTALSCPAPTPTPTNRPFSPTPGTYDAVVAAAAVQYHLESLLAAFHAAGVPRALLEQHLDDARAAVDTALDAWMAGCRPC